MRFKLLPAGARLGNGADASTQWQAVQEVCATLRDHGYQALLAGGSVRDFLMGRIPNDFDVATSATPDQVEGLFAKSIAVGKAFGVIVLPFGDFQIEVATFREDLDYRDGRRPEKVRFVNAELDAKRRDFTVNALFYDPVQDLILDFVGGEKDIERRTIRAVGDPEQRFAEDKLRLIRAVRFAAQLDFEIDAATLRAIQKHAIQLTVVSRERLHDELIKLMKSQNPQKGMELLKSTGLMSSMLPELDKLTEKLTDENWQKRVVGGGSVVVNLACFFLPLALKSLPELEACLKALKFSNETLSEIIHVLRYTPRLLKPKSERVGEIAVLLADPLAPEMIAFAERLEKVDCPWQKDPDWATQITAIKSAALTENGSLPPAFIRGEDLKALGFKSGPEFGSTLKELQFLQLEGKLKTREDALAWLKNRIKY